MDENKLDEELERITEIIELQQIQIESLFNEIKDLKSRLEFVERTNKRNLPCR